jgi:hypothetical protein
LLKVCDKEDVINSEEGAKEFVEAIGQAVKRDVEKLKIKWRGPNNNTTIKSYLSRYPDGNISQLLKLAEMLETKVKLYDAGTSTGRCFNMRNSEGS